MAHIRSINKLSLIGNLTRDAELRQTKGGQEVLTINLATNTAYKSKAGEKVEDTTFHRVSVWGKSAEALSKFLVKGMKIYIEGRLSYQDIKDNEGKTIARQANINADEVIVLASANGATSGVSKEADQALNSLFTGE